ncbi:Efk-1 [Aphelenchoides fujianensis]|nr:Efk-1 [Aphelenchoides fujianensis]KAI6234829.1 Efk-1 [Aphelenchoides fujianensis]
MSEQHEDCVGNENESSEVVSHLTTAEADVVSWMSETVEAQTSGYGRETLAPHVLRELNKRLRTIFEDDGREYGKDAKTAKELQQQQRTAIKIRNEQLLQAMQRIRTSRHVDLCFVVDATGSMTGYIQEVKDVVHKIVRELVPQKADDQSGSKAMVNTLRLAFVAYRDYDYSKRFEILPFTKRVDEFSEFCANIKAEYAWDNDDPEDVLGGLNKALGLKWSRLDNTKVIFHICDQPAHGKQFQTRDYPWPDRFPAGDPNGLTADGIFERIVERGINYYFGKISDYTNKMIKTFSDAMCEPIDQFDIKNVHEISTSVISAVSKSVSNSMRKTGTLNGRPERTYRIDLAMPTSWDAHAVQVGKFIAYEFPQSIEDIVNDVPLQRCRPEVARIQIAPNPFARGGERIAYYGRDLHTNEDVVLKEYRRLSSGLDSARRHEVANQQQTIASYFAALFMADCEEKVTGVLIPATLEFLLIKTVALGLATAPRYMSCEQRLNPTGRYVRFTNNLDFVMSEASAKPNGISVQVLKFVLAFSHYTYAISGGRLMIVDLQGTIKPSDGGRPTVMLTDPAIHSENRTRFGATNHSKAGMSVFFQRHRCNKFCRALGLPKVDPSKIFRA